MIYINVYSKALASACIDHVVDQIAYPYNKSKEEVILAQRFESAGLNALSVVMRRVTDNGKPTDLLGVVYLESEVSVLSRLKKS